MALTDRQRELREAFVDARGQWNELFEGVLELDPDFFVAYARLEGHPWREGGLEPKVKELVLVAIDAAATHLYAPGIREHVRKALALGATREELMEVLELTSTLGIHACNIGVPILLEELGESQDELADAPLTTRQQEIKDDFTAKRGYWNPFWDGMLHLDAEFLAAYTEFSAVPWVSGVLEPKVKELIYTAFDVSVTHLYTLGLRQHIRNALDYGATREEVMEVFELASQIGMQACLVGVPILLEEAEVPAR
jgi:alkylhydroperoxidase/carboxymuconolactone decarboxylase family protein YurZ